MKATLWLTLFSGLFMSISAISQEKVRAHVKCHLQLEDNSIIVYHFVNTDKNYADFINALPTRPVFMADGVTEKSIKNIYECVDAKARFKGKKANEVDENTAF